MQTLKTSLASMPRRQAGPNNVKDCHAFGVRQKKGNKREPLFFVEDEARKSCALFCSSAGNSRSKRIELK
jgi:hypothetical protein